MSNHNNNQKKPIEAKKPEETRTLTPAQELEAAILNHAYLLEELKTRDISKLLWYVRKHRAAKQNESAS